MSGGRAVLAVRHDAGVRLLLLSNSTVPGREYLEHVRDEVADLVSGADQVALVPYGRTDHDDYTGFVAAAFKQFGVPVVGTHTGAGHRAETSQDAEAGRGVGSCSPTVIVRDSQVVVVGGGNTFRLVDALYRFGLIEAIREAVGSGARYLGSSAGATVATPSLKTTNDMPIVEPPSFETLGLVPFQINPHFRDAQAGSKGESRDQRLRGYLEQNATPCLAMREGTWLRREGGELYFEGLEVGGRLYVRDAPVREIPTPADLSELLLN